MGNVPSIEEQQHQQGSQGGQSPQYGLSPKELSQKHQKNCAQLNQTNLGLSTETRGRTNDYKGPRQMSIAERIFFSELMEDDIFDDYELVKKQVEDKLKNDTDVSADSTTEEHYETLENDSENDDDRMPHKKRDKKHKDKPEKRIEPIYGDNDGYVTDEDDSDDEESHDQNPQGELSFELDFNNPKSQKVYSKAVMTGNITWRVSAIPLGPRNTHLSLFVEIVGIRDFKPGRVIRTRFTLYLKNRSDPTNTQLHQCEHNFVAPGEDWGFQDFAPLSEITGPSNGFLSEKGTITVCAKLENLPDLTNDLLPDEHSGRDSTGYVGLRTQGSAFYVNSLIQALYHTSALAQVVFNIQTEQQQKTKKSSKEGKVENSVVMALQDTFFKMRFARKPPSVQPLINSFGWNREDSFVQHDVQEFDHMLLESITSKTVGTPLEGSIKKLFWGSERHVIRCADVQFEKVDNIDFHDITIDVRDFRSLEEFFSKRTATKVLEGKDKYITEEFGAQNATKECQFTSFPPVLHIQLKRWAIDQSTESQVKVNNRFEFPTKIDLAKYLGDSAPKDESYMYKLHAILVHSGAAQGGNYYVYIRPTLSGKWLKFNDECVSQASLSQVLESSYGGEAEYFINASGEKTASGEKYSNMLVYIRKNSDVLFPIKAKDIPIGLHKRGQQLRDAVRARLRDYCESKLYARFGAYTEEKMASSDLEEDLFSLRNATEFRISRNDTCDDLYTEVARHTGRRRGFFRIWGFTHRKNGTARPSGIIPDSEDELVSDYARADSVINRIFVEDTTEQPDSFNKETHGLLFLLSYEPLPTSGRLSYLGCQVVCFEDRLEKVAEMSRILAGIPLDSRLAMFDIVRLSCVDPLPLHKTIKDLQLRTGDINVIQAIPNDSDAKGMRYPCVQSWFSYLEDRTTVSFRKLSQPDVEIIRVKMLKHYSYEEVTNNLAKELGDPSVNARNIRLTGCKDYVNGPQITPFKLGDNLTLKSMLMHLASNGQERLSGILYYEVLKRPLEEIENERVLDVVWMPMDMQTPEKVTLRVDRKGKVANLLSQVAEKYPSQKGGSGKYRLLEVFRGKVYKEYASDSPISAIPETRGQKTVYRVEEKTFREDKMNDDDVRIQVVHLTNETSEKFFGSPFYLVVSKDTKLIDVKKEIQKRLDVPYNDFAKYKFAFISSVSVKLATNDNAIIDDLMGTFEYFGIIHQDKKPPPITGSIAIKK